MSRPWISVFNLHFRKRGQCYLLNWDLWQWLLQVVPFVLETRRMISQSTQAAESVRVEKLVCVRFRLSTNWSWACLISSVQ